MFEISLEAARSNDRLWFSINKRLASLYLDLGRVGDVETLLAQLKGTCRLPSGLDDPAKGGNLLGVYCLEIQLCTLTGKGLHACVCVYMNVYIPLSNAFLLSPPSHLSLLYCRYTDNIPL